MFIDLNDIGRDGVRFDTGLDLGPLKGPGEEQYPVEDLRFTGEAKPGKRGVEFRARLQGRLTLPCSRCLEGYTLDLDEDVFLILMRKAWEFSREIEVGDRALDDAFVIRGQGDVAGMLDDIRPELLSLAPLGLTLTSTGERLQATVKSPREDKLEPAIDALFTIWRRLAQLGLRHD